jgi:hypothetical protein
MRSRIFALLLLTAVMAGCLRENFAEKEQVLTLPELSSVTLEAEVLGEDSVYDTVVTQILNVRANRSWSAVIEYEGDQAGWLELSEEELLNLHEYSVDEPVTLTARRNENTESRKARIIFSSDAEHKVTIPVEQKAQVRFLEVEANRSEALSIRDTVTASIHCNTSWKVAVDSLLTTAGISLSVEEGKDYGVLKIAFEENFDATQGRTAVIKLSALGVDSPKDLVITQKEGAPYIEFRMSDTELSPEVSRVVLKFGASVNWSLSIKSQNGMDGASFSTTTGGPTSSGDVVLNLPLNGEDPGISKSITIELSASGLEPKTCTLTQKGCIHLYFLKVTAPGEERPYSFYWPFASPAKSEIPVSAITGTYRDQSLVLTMPGGSVFTACSMDWGTGGGIWYNAPKQGFLIGNGKGSYLEFPAVQGLALKTVIWEPSWLIGTKGKITDSEGNVIKGGEQWDSHGGGANTVTEELMENHYFNLELTEPGTAYRLVSINNGVALSFKDLILIYE